MSFIIRIAVALVCVTFALRAQAQLCPGDCNSDLLVTVDEIISCVNIGLGNVPAARCARCDFGGDGAVTVDEIVRSVIAALGNFNVTAQGTCMRPGTTDLVPCAAGTQVQMSRCNDRRTCLEGNLTALKAVAADAEGKFTIEVSGCQVAGSTLIFEAPVGPVTKYRAIDFGPVATSGSGSGADLRDVMLSPTSEAAVRFIDDRGLENFDNESVLTIVELVDQANAETDFGGLTAEEAVLLALNVARNDPPLRATATARQFTPTPSPTSMVGPTNTPSTVTLRIDDAVAAPGQTATVSVNTELVGRTIEGIQLHLVLDPPVAGVTFSQLGGLPRCTTTCTGGVVGADGCLVDFVFFPPDCVLGVDCLGVRVTGLNLDTGPPGNGGSYSCQVDIGAGVAPGTTVNVRVTDMLGGQPCAGAVFVAEGDDEEPLGCSDGRITVSGTP